MIKSEYPKVFWVLTQAEVIVQDDKEVVNHDTDQMIGGTFDTAIAEKMISLLRDNQSTSTMVKSNISTQPTNVINNVINQLLSMVDV